LADVFLFGGVEFIPDWLPGGDELLTLGFVMLVLVGFFSGLALSFCLGLLFLAAFGDILGCKLVTS